MNKSNIKTAILEIQQSIVTTYEQRLEAYKQASDIDEEDTIDPEDLSHQDEATEMAQILKQQLLQAKIDIENTQKISTERVAVVSPGCYLKTNYGVFYIAASTGVFELEGIQMRGLSLASPLYKKMQGKRVGDSFAFKDKYYKILTLQ